MFIPIVYERHFAGPCIIINTLHSYNFVIMLFSYHQSEGFSPMLRTPLVTRRDSFTITLECTRDPLLYAWSLQNISSIEVRGIPINSSCEENRECIPSVVPSPDYPERCFQAQTNRIILDQFQHCYGMFWGRVLLELLV